MKVRLFRLQEMSCFRMFFHKNYLLAFLKKEGNIILSDN